MTMLRTTGTSEDGIPVLLALIRIQLQMAKLVSRLKDMLNNALLSTSREGQNCTKSLKPRSPAVMQPGLRSSVLSYYCTVIQSELGYSVLSYRCTIWCKTRCAVVELYNYT